MAEVQGMGLAGFDAGRTESAFPMGGVEDGMPAFAFDQHAGRTGGDAGAAGCAGVKKTALLPGPGRAQRRLDGRSASQERATLEG